MPSDYENLRLQILQVLYRHDKSGDSTYLKDIELVSAIGSNQSHVEDQLDILETRGLVDLSRSKTSIGARLAALGKLYVLEGPEAVTTSAQLNIGALIGNMTGGNLQSVGSATNSQISQAVNDLSAFDDVLDKLLAVVRDELCCEVFSSYERVANELREEIHAARPNDSRIRKLLAPLSFFGDVEGTISLATRVAPLIQSLLILATNLQSH